MLVGIMFLKCWSSWAIGIAFIHTCLLSQSEAAVSTHRTKALETTIQGQINRVPWASSLETEILISGSDLIQLSLESFGSSEPFFLQHREKDCVLKLLLSFFGRFSFGFSTEIQKRFLEGAIVDYQTHQNNWDEIAGKAFSSNLLHFLNERKKEIDLAIHSTQEKLLSHTENQIQSQLKYAESLGDVLSKIEVYNQLLTQNPLHVQTLLAAISLCKTSGIDPVFYTNQMLSINSYGLTSVKDKAIVDSFQTQAAADFAYQYYTHQVPHDPYFFEYPKVNYVLPPIAADTALPNSSTEETQSDTDSASSRQEASSSSSVDHSEEKMPEGDKTRKKVERKEKRLSHLPRSVIQSTSKPPEEDLKTNVAHPSLGEEEKKEEKNFEREEKRGKKALKKTPIMLPLRDAEELALELKTHPTYALLNEAKYWLSRNHIIDFPKTIANLSSEEFKKVIHLLLSLAHLTQFNIHPEARAHYLMSARAIALHLKDLPEYFECQKTTRLLLRTFPVARIMEDMAIFEQSESLKDHWKNLAEDLRSSRETQSLKFADFAEAEARFLESMPLSPSDQEIYLSSQALFKIQFSQVRGFQTTEQALEFIDSYQDILVYSKYGKKNEKIARTLFRYGETLSFPLRPLFLLSSSISLLRIRPSPTHAELARIYFEEILSVTPSNEREEKLKTKLIRNYVEVFRRYSIKKNLGLDTRTRNLIGFIENQNPIESEFLSEEQAYVSIQDQMKSF